VKTTALCAYCEAIIVYTALDSYFFRQATDDIKQFSARNGGTAICLSDTYTLSDHFDFQVSPSDPEAIAINLKEYVGKDGHGLPAFNNTYGCL